MKPSLLAELLPTSRKEREKWGAQFVFCVIGVS
jgi:hypothetical protein